MDNLPSELVLHIFNFLPIKCTLILKCVSKKFKQLTNLLRYESLILNADDSELKESDYFYLINLKDEELFFSISTSPTFTKIKSLVSHLYSDSLIKESQFYNQFIELEELECKHLYPTEKIYLKLKKLRKLKANCSNCIFDLNTPSLVKLKVYKYDQVNLIYETKLKYLKIYSCLFEEDRFRIYKLINLEKMIIYKDTYRLINNTLLKKLINLNEFRIQNLNPYTNLIEELTFERKNLKIFICGFKIDDFRNIENQSLLGFFITYRIDHTLDYLINNYDNIDYEIKGNHSLYFTNSAKNLLNQISIDKLKNKIKKIAKFHEKKDCEFKDDKLLELIEKFNIKSLKLKTIKQSFFNRLILVNESINELNLSLNQKIKLNDLDFIFKLKNLKDLIISNCSFYVDLLIKIVKLPNKIWVSKFLNPNKLNLYISVYHNYYDTDDLISFSCFNSIIYNDIEFNSKYDYLVFLNQTKSTIFDYVFLIDKFNDLKSYNNLMFKILSKNQFLYEIY